jgi:signal transduction histidine kinase
VAGVTHEINTPLGAIQSANGNIQQAINNSLDDLPALAQRLPERQWKSFTILLEQVRQDTEMLSTREERQKKRELSKHLETQGITQVALVADRLVNMGIYEDIDAYLPLLQDDQCDFILKVAYDLSRLHTNSANIQLAGDRAGKMLFALRNYTYEDRSDVRVLSSIPDGLETVLTLYQNQFKQGVEVVREYGEVPLIRCYPDELNQVWTNLIHNALQAMEHKGRLTVLIDQRETDALEDRKFDAPRSYVVVSITDSGSGISDDDLPHIFEPFFTTKPIGEGTGLGLDISHRIVEAHNGVIKVESHPGRTTFEVWLPVEMGDEETDVK